MSDNPDDPTTGGVVDGDLRVFGTENLLVADLSVAPTPPAGNTCWAAYMIGLQAASICGYQIPGCPNNPAACKNLYKKVHCRN